MISTGGSDVESEFESPVQREAKMNNRSSMHAGDKDLLKILGVDKEQGAGSSKTNSSHSHRSRSGVLSKRGTSVGASVVVVSRKQSKQSIKKKSSSRSIASGSKTG